MVWQLRKLMEFFYYNLTILLTNNDLCLLCGYSWDRTWKQPFPPIKLYSFLVRYRSNIISSIEWFIPLVSGWCVKLFQVMQSICWKDNTTEWKPLDNWENSVDNVRKKLNELVCLPVADVPSLTTAEHSCLRPPLLTITLPSTVTLFFRHSEDHL